MAIHDQKVERIALALRERKSTSPLTLKKKAVSHQVPKPMDKKYTDEKLDISGLNDIITINPSEMTCVAEPGVTFYDLVRATGEYGLAPATVPELKEITIGGAVAGGSLESMSFKRGGFHDSCLEYEVITAKGAVMTCSPDYNPLLFQMLNGTFGTLGIITKLKFFLIRASKFVKITHDRFSSTADYLKAIRYHYEKQDVDFMDGIIFSPEKCVLSLGNFCETAPYTHSYEWTRSYFDSMKNGKEDYLTSLQYFFRYDKGITSTFPKSFLGRLLFGRFIGSAAPLAIAEKAHEYIKPGMIPVTVDLFIPEKEVPDFMEWYIREINYFPLWCVPYRLARKYEWLSAEFFEMTRGELFLDLAIYNMRRNDKNYYRLLEEKLMEIGALKSLISNNFYTEEEFWKTWNRDNYFKVKLQTDPDNILRTLYEKTCLAARGIGR